MSTDDQAPARYHFSSAVDVLTAFEHLGIEHLEVSNERTIVIYQRTIFNFDVLSGHLDTAQTVGVEVGCLVDVEIRLVSDAATGI